MKYWVILLLLIPFVFAGEIQHVDLVNNEYVFVTLAERDMVDFVYNDSTQRLMIREIIPEENIVKLTFFMGGMENPLYTRVSNELKLQIDFEKDGFNDINVWYAGLEGENVTLKIEKIHEEKKTTKVGFFDGVIDNWNAFLENIKKGSVKRFYNEKIGFGLIILILIIVILFSNRRFVRRKFRRVKRRLRGY